MKYLLLFFSALLVSCSYNYVTPSTSLDGKWIESVRKRDTIVFDQKLNSNERKHFVFKSDKGITGYSSLYSTIYEYKVDRDKISIYNSVSSCYCFSDYYFTFVGDKILIENFYNSNSKGVIETFVKL
jgi:hypothetical protein